MPRNILFLTLRVFSATGGVEKMSRVIGKILEDNYQSCSASYRILSSHDTDNQAHGNRYFPAQRFSGYGLSRICFILSALYEGCRADLLLLSHVNLLPVAWLIKIFRPGLKVVMWAHGIELWQLPLGRKKRMLTCLSEIVCVSQYTLDRIAALPEIKKVPCRVIHNCLDPFLPVPDVLSREKSEILRRKYGIPMDQFVFFTLTRMDASERYKGYDRVIEALSQSHSKLRHSMYLIGGAYDGTEIAYLKRLIQEKGMEGRVVFSGFIPDAELAEHFLLADAYIMPSRHEGFGIVFIEAMFYGLPVIAGNKDGSVDALRNGEFGSLVDPEDIQAIRHAMEATISNRKTMVPNRDMLLRYFGYDEYKHKIQQVLGGSIC